MIELLLLPVLLLQQACPLLDPPGSCPQVFRVLPEGAGPEPTLKVLFVGDGFLESDLNTYRCAVDSLSRSILDSSVFDEYACAIGMYRMDLVDPDDRGPISTLPPARCDGDNRDDGDRGGGRIPVDPACTDCACEGHAVTAVFPQACPAGTALLPGASGCARIPDDRRFGTALCRRGLCRLTWPDLVGEAAALHYATCVPGGADLVVILSNTAAVGGGGRMAGDVSLVALTLSDIAEPAAWRRLAHEMGHALFGLLDEYQAAFEDWIYRPGLNIVRTSELREGHIPWSPECPGGECEIRCGDRALTAPPDTVGAVEGAFYHRCGFFRSSPLCRMRSDNNAFCPACRRAAREILRTRYGVDGCSDLLP